MLSRVWGVVLAGVLAAGCEDPVILLGSVTVTPEVQRLFSAEQPGALFFETELPEVGPIVYRLAVLCEPRAEPLITTLRHRDVGCARRSEARAYVVSIAPGAPGTPCAVTQVRANGRPVSEWLASTTHVLFAGTPEGCPGGEEQFEMVLGLPPAP